MKVLWYTPKELISRIALRENARIMMLMANNHNKVGSNTAEVEEVANG